jgi:hypothetical protein
MENCFTAQETVSGGSGSVCEAVDMHSGNFDKSDARDCTLPKSVITVPRVISQSLTLPMASYRQIKTIFFGYIHLQSPVHRQMP